MVIFLLRDQACTRHKTSGIAELETQSIVSNARRIHVHDIVATYAMRPEYQIMLYACGHTATCILYRVNS